MSREIKFRIWDKKYRTFDYNASPEIFISTDGEVYEKDERNWAMQSWIEYNKTDNYELSQYTGLKEKNGVEIYEGDILLFNNSINNRKWKCVVKYREGSFVCVYLNDNIYNHFDSWNVPKVTWEVIGNIYQNPELLERGE